MNKTTFAELGVRVSRSYKTRTTSIGMGGPIGHMGGMASMGTGTSIELSSSTTTQLTLTLPEAGPITASFCKEGLGRKLIKLFKKELQTGDPTFDDTVYISTDTTEATAAWLADAAVRADILELIEAEATIERRSPSWSPSSRRSTPSSGWSPRKPTSHRFPSEWTAAGLDGLAAA